MGITAEERARTRLEEAQKGLARAISNKKRRKPKTYTVTLTWTGIVEWPGPDDDPDHDPYYEPTVFASLETDVEEAAYFALYHRLLDPGLFSHDNWSAAVQEEKG
jgi:hypothetical protein